MLTNFDLNQQRDEDLICYMSIKFCMYMQNCLTCTGIDFYTQLKKHACHLGPHTPLPLAVCTVYGPVHTCSTVTLQSTLYIISYFLRDCFPGDTCSFMLLLIP